MPQASPTVPTGTTPLRYSYQELAKALKALHPRFAQEDDAELVHAVVRLYPRFKQGLDVDVLEGAEGPGGPLEDPLRRAARVPRITIDQAGRVSGVDVPEGPPPRIVSLAEMPPPVAVRRLAATTWEAIGAQQGPMRAAQSVLTTVPQLDWREAIRHPVETTKAVVGEALAAGTRMGDPTLGQTITSTLIERQPNWMRSGWWSALVTTGVVGPLPLLIQSYPEIAGFLTDVSTDPWAWTDVALAKVLATMVRGRLSREATETFSRTFLGATRKEALRAVPELNRPVQARDFIAALERRGEPFVPIQITKPPPPVAGLLPARTPGSAVRVYPPGSRIDVLGGEDAARRIIVSSEGPPLGIPGGRAGEVTSAWGDLRLAGEPPPAVPEQPPLGLGVGRTGRKGRGRRIMLGRTEGIGGPLIETSPGGAPPTVEQRRLSSRSVLPAHAVADPEYPVFQELYTQAQAEGFTGDAVDFWERFTRERQSLQGLAKGLAEDVELGARTSSHSLLKAIADIGGFSPYTYDRVMKGPKLRKVRRRLDGIGEIRNRTPGGGVAGVRGVIRAEGLPFDQMETILKEQGMLQPDQTLIGAVQDVSRARVTMPSRDWSSYLPAQWWKAYEGPPRPGISPTPRQQQLTLENLDTLADDLGAKAVEGAGDVEADAIQFFKAVDDLAAFHGASPRGSRLPPERSLATDEALGARVRQIAARKPGEVLPLAEPPPAVPDQLPAQYRTTAGEPTTITPPPAVPGTPESPTRSFLDRLKEEQGAIVLDVLPGVRQADQLKRWLDRHRAQYGNEAWWKQAKAASDAGDHGKAWRIAAAASARSVGQASTKVSQQDQATLRQARSGAGLPPEVPLLTPQGAARVPGRSTEAARRAEAIAGGAWVNKAGILEPPPPARPAPARLTSRLLGEDVMEEILNSVDPEGVIWPSREIVKQHPEMQIGRQIAEKILLGQVRDRAELEALLQLSGLDTATYFRQTASSFGRGLNLLRQWATKHEAELDRLISLSGGSPLPADRTLDVLAQQGRSADRAMALTAVLNGSEAKWTKVLTEEAGQPLEQKLGLFQGLVFASISPLLAKPGTAIRNFWMGVSRYNIGALDKALASGLARYVMRDGAEAAEHWAVARQLIKSEGLAGRTAGGVGAMPAHPQALELQKMYDLTAETLTGASPTDVRHVLKLFVDAPDQGPLHAFLGRVGGADIKRGVIETPILKRVINPLLDPRNQAKITILNRAQEFQVRSPIADAVVRAQLEVRGLDANRLLTAPRAWEEITYGLGEDGPEILHGILQQAAGTALDWTFASEALKGTWPAKLLDFLYQPFIRPAVQTVQPFPRFNFLSVPRFLYDHSPLPLFDGLVRGIPRAFGMGAGKVGGPRYVLGMEAKRIQRLWLPELTEKRRLMQSRVSALSAEVKTAQAEVRRLTGEARRPGAVDLTASIEHARGATQEVVARLMDARDGELLLRRQIGRTRGRLESLQAIGVPTPSEAIARMASGTVGLFGLAMFLRSQPAAEGMEWFEYQWEQAKRLDLRAYAPLLQYLLPADVVIDVWRNTDWERVKASGADEGGSPIDYYQALREHYTGKYTPERFTKEMLRAYASFNQAAGSTLTLADFMARPEFTPSRFGEVAIGVTGQLVARYFVPLQVVSEVVGGVAQAAAPLLPEPAAGAARAIAESELTARIPPPPTVENYGMGPLAAPLANIPGVRGIIPPEVSQTTGEPIRSEQPLARALGGLTIRERDTVLELVRATGVAPSSVYIRETGITGLDQRVAFHYSKALKELLPRLTHTPWFLGLPNGALRRDYLQREAFPLIKDVAIARVMVEQGPRTVQEARTSPAERTRRRLWMEHLQKLAEELPKVPEVEEETTQTAPVGPPRVPD